MFSKARYLSKIGSWEEAVVAYNDILQREKVGTSKKIDVAMEKAKIALFNLVTARLLLYINLFFVQFKVSAVTLFVLMYL